MTDGQTAGLVDLAGELKTLIRFNTTNPPGNEKPLLLYIKELLASHGIPSVFLETAKNRGNLVAVLRPTEQATKPNLVFLSHVDVVGADPTQWDFPPFGAKEKDGFIYGRGTIDTKQLTVMQISAFLALHKAGGPANRNVFFVATSDEENGSEQGLLALLESEICIEGQKWLGQTVFAGASVMSEGGGFPIRVGQTVVYLCETGQKGVAQVELTAKARVDKGAFFPSTDGLRRALQGAAAISKISEDELVLPSVDYFISRLLAIAGLEKAPTAGENIMALSPFLSPFMANILGAMVRNTYVVTKITGENLATTTIAVDCRLLPSTTKADLEALFAPLAQRFDLDWKITSFSPGYGSDTGGDFYDELIRATRSVLGQDMEVLPFYTIGSSDGRHLVPSKADVYGYGPVHYWDMTFDQAVPMVHGKNERIHRDSLVLGAEILTRLAIVASGNTKELEAKQ